MLSFLELFDALNSKSVQYLVAGGWAVNLYGIERATGDLDLVVYLEQQNLEKFIEVMEQFRFKPKAPVVMRDFTFEEKRREWRDEKGMIVFSFFDPLNPFVLLDVFIDFLLISLWSTPPAPRYERGRLKYRWFLWQRLLK
jgi:hypothetical protein